MENYPTGNTALIGQLSLETHPEGGYYAETDRQKDEVPTPFCNGEPRSLATSIYYLLSHDNSQGVIHMNKSVTYHVLHQGRAEYTLITPGSPPTIEKKIMGIDIAAGETRLLIVGSGIWKMSQLLDTDLENAETGLKVQSDYRKDHTGCLITEVVVPGFHWEDHKYLDYAGLEKLFEGAPDGSKYIEELKQFVKN